MTQNAPHRGHDVEISFLMRTKFGGFKRARLDPGLAKLAAAGVVMAASLASFFVAWLVEDLARLHSDIVVLAVALAFSLGRAQRDSDARARAIGAVLLPVAAAAASEIGTLMATHAPLGDALFSSGVAAATFARRFGPVYAKAGTLATLPLIAVLVAPPAGDGLSHALWAALIATAAMVCVTISQLLARHLGVLVPPAPRPLRPAATTSARPSAPSAPRRPRRGAVALSTRMAIQMAVGLGTAFALSHQLFPGHWSWTVLSSYIVASANRGRGDVVHKSGLRVVGASCGTIAATFLSGTFGPGDRSAVVAIFAVLALASWLRSFSYAYWAACVTAALAFLHGYFGEQGTSLLLTRLEGIGCGAVIAIAASWFVLPIKTRDIVRRRAADALAVLTDYVGAAQRGDPDQLSEQRARFGAAVAQLDQVAATHVPGWVSRGNDGRDRPANAVAALRPCLVSVHALTEQVGAQPPVLTVPLVRRELDALHGAVLAARRAIAGGQLPVPALAAVSGAVARLVVTVGTYGVRATAASDTSSSGE